MTKAEIIASLLDQARDKDALANGEADSIFADDARALREAAELLKSVPEWVSVRASECATMIKLDAEKDA